MHLPTRLFIHLVYIVIIISPAYIAHERSSPLALHPLTSVPTFLCPVFALPGRRIATSCIHITPSLLRAFE